MDIAGGRLALYAAAPKQDKVSHLHTAKETYQICTICQLKSSMPYIHNIARPIDPDVYIAEVRKGLNAAAVEQDEFLHLPTSK